MKPFVFKIRHTGRWGITAVGQPFVVIGQWNGYRRWHDAMTAALDFIAVRENG